MGARRLRALIQGLPTTSAVYRSVNPDTWFWGPTEELLATLIDSTEVGNLMFLGAHKTENTRVPEFVPVHRPGERPRVLETPDRHDEITSFFA